MACHHKNKDLAKTVRHDAVAMDKIEKGWHHTAQRKSCKLCAYPKGVKNKGLTMGNSEAFIFFKKSPPAIQVRAIAVRICLPANGNLGFAFYQISITRSALVVPEMPKGIPETIMTDWPVFAICFSLTRFTAASTASSYSDSS